MPMRILNLFPSFTELQRDFCYLAACVDPDGEEYDFNNMEAVKKAFSSLLRENDTSRLIVFMIEQRTPVNYFLLNYMRAFSLRPFMLEKWEGPPPTLEYVARRAINNHFIDLRNEMVAIANAIIAIKPLYEGRCSITEDLEIIKDIKENNPNYQDSDKWRRRVMSHYVAISHKETA